MTTQTRKPARFATPDQARSFDRQSWHNAAMAAQVLVDRGTCKGECVPYQDIFTYERWRAQGFQVKRGEHGVKLSVLVHRTREDDDGNTVDYSVPQTTAVFCRCQVDSKK